jgi:transcriptional regulator with XRE-family HTH domain
MKRSTRRIAKGGARQARAQGNAPAGCDAGVTPFSQILRYMVSTHGQRIGLIDGEIDFQDVGHLRRDEEDRALADLAQRMGIEEKNVRRLWTGQSARPQKRTVEALVHVFKTADPDLVPAQFWASSLDSFLKYPRPIDQVQLQVPGYARGLGRLEQRLCGTFVAYRYPFEGNDEQKVCREVVHIWRDKGAIRFRMSFLPKDDGEAPPGEFRGTVLKIDNSLLFLGQTPAGEDGLRPRGRTMFVCDELELEPMRRTMFGLLTSTRLFGGGAPCAACTILVRVERKDLKPATETSFVAQATRILPIVRILGADFAASDVATVRLFLDNRPVGSLRDETDSLDKELIDADRRRRNRDPVMRLNLQRFSDEMPVIVERALRDDSLNSAFKPNWRAPGF